MLQELKKEANYTFTENGALTYQSTMDHCLDLFAVSGALRNADEEEIIKRFVKAYTENPDIAMKILFYTRDIRGGLGERRFFKIILKYLAQNHAGSVIKNLRWAARYGRFDDILVLMDTPCEEAAIIFLKEQLDADIEHLHKGEEDISLLAKWLPSVNTSSAEKVRLGKKLAKAFGMSQKEYRQTLAALRRKIDIIEDYLRRVDYSFDYEEQPGKAMLKYRRAFERHDAERYHEFLNNVVSGEAVLHTGTVMPYEIIRPFYDGIWTLDTSMKEEEKKALNAMWNAQEDFTNGQNTLAVIDGSGSMYYGGYESVCPAMAAQSLGLYFAERNTGAFANHFITFSERPQLIEIKGKDLGSKLRDIEAYREVADTNIQAVFELILKTAVKYHLSQSDMPKRLVIISDMEFNFCTKDAGVTNFDYAKHIFEEAGYKLPNVVFWNVQSRKCQIPVTKNEQGAVLVSGFNPRIFKMVLEDYADPYEFMMKALGSERYKGIVA